MSKLWLHTLTDTLVRLANKQIDVATAQDEIDDFVEELILTRVIGEDEPLVGESGAWVVPAIRNGLRTEMRNKINGGEL